MSQDLQLKLLLEPEDAVLATLAMITAPGEVLSHEEWKGVQETWTGMKPLDQVTVRICYFALAVMLFII